MLDTALRFAASFLPEGVAIIVGLVLAVVRRKVEPQVAAPAVAGLALHLVAVGLSTVVVLVVAQVTTTADLARANQLGAVLGLVVIVLRLLGWTLLLIALFRRLPGGTTPRDTTPTGRHALLDEQGEQVVAEEGQSLYPDEHEDFVPLGTGPFGAGDGTDRTGALDTEAFGQGAFGKGDREGAPDPAPSFPAPFGPGGSETPTEAVPVAGAVVAEPDERDGVPAEESEESGASDLVEQDLPEDALPKDDLPEDPEVDADGDTVLDEAPETDDTAEPDTDAAAETETETETGTGTAAEVDAGTVTADGDARSAETPPVPPEEPPADEAEGAVEGRPPLPVCTSTPVLRTDFSDDDAWEVARTAIVGPDEVEAPPNLEVINDPAYADLSSAEVVALATEDSIGTHACLFVVDHTTTTSPEHAVLVVDLREERGREFRCAASEIQAVETSLAISATDFVSFADAVADDGVFRGF